MTKTIDELEFSARMIWRDMEQLKQHYGLELPEYVQLENFRFYFTEIGVSIKPVLNIGKEPIAINIRSSNETDPK